MKIGPIKKCKQKYFESARWYSHFSWRSLDILVVAPTCSGVQVTMPPRGWIKCLNDLNRLHGPAGAIRVWLYPFKKSRDNFCAGIPPSETRTDNPYLCRNGPMISVKFEFKHNSRGALNLTSNWAYFWATMIGSTGLLSKRSRSKRPSGNIFEWLVRWHAK